MERTSYSLAALFVLALPCCFDVHAARHVGLGGLRADAGPCNDRPFHVAKVKLLRPLAKGGKRDKLHPVYAAVTSGNVITQAHLDALQEMREEAHRRQRAIFRTALFERRTQKQADLLRSAVAARRARRA